MNTFSEAAFGVHPERWPLPAACTGVQHWQRAVVAGGQGRYASAFADLEATLRWPGTLQRASLASSTWASFLRQLGWHELARGWDGRALALAGADDEALADALIGLAADALGVGRFALAERLLERARGTLDAAESKRLPVRLAWVRAELAMATGRGVDAVRHAGRAVELAAHLDSVRHAVKSDVVSAAAACCAGDLEQARTIADRALLAAQESRLVPLTWALACLLRDIGSASLDADAVTAIRDDSAAWVRAQGGAWAKR